MIGHAQQLNLYWRALGALGLTFVIYALWAYNAHAQGSISYSSFSCNGGTASGGLFSSHCPYSLTRPDGSIDLEHIFSFFVCNVERITTELFGNLYCGMIVSLAPGVYAVATLAVLCFGMAFSVGIIDFTARELMTFFMKIVLFIAFTTEADMMIGIAYNFFVTGAQTGITVALSGLYEGNSVCSNTGAGGSDVYCMLDHFLYTFLFDPLTSITASVGADVNSGANPCKNAVIAALGLLAIAFPPVFYIALLILLKVAMVFVRGVYGYLFAIVGLAFLMVISPIYLSFGLFRQTRPLFDKYLGYLVSFSLQMIFVFTFLAFVLSLPLSHVSGSLMSVIVYQKTTYEGNTWRFPWEYCSICDFNIYEIVDPDDESRDILISDPNVKINSAKHRLRCKDPIKALEPLALVSPQPDGSGQNPVTAGQKLQNKLMDFAMYGLLGLLVLALVIDKLLSLIPFLAQNLAGYMGASFAPMLGGGRQANGTTLMGREAIDLPFESNMRAFSDGFSSGFTRGTPDGNGGFSKPTNSISGLASGLAEGSTSLVAGTRRDPGMVGGLVRYLANPQAGASVDE